MSQSKLKIVIVGDSTAATYDAARAPEMGWGQTFGRFFAESVAVKNHAYPGRSSKSFIDEGRLARALDDLAPGDWLFIQFGHNDAKKEDPARYTEPETTYKEHLAVYIRSARERGANPLLLTPIERRHFNAAGTIEPTHGAYPQAMIELGEAMHTPVIDITEKSRALFERLGPEPTKELFLWLKPGEHPNYPQGVEDNTHFQERGAVEIGKLVIEGLKEIDSPLVAHLAPGWASVIGG